MVVRRVAMYSPDELAISVISVEEQLSGWYSKLRRAKKPNQLAQVYQRLTTNVASLSRLQIVPLSEAAIYRYEALRKLRLNIGKMDLRIASIALELGATVVTRNLTDFRRVPGLSSEDWSQ